MKNSVLARRRANSEPGHSVAVSGVNMYLIPDNRSSRGCVHKD